MHVDRNVCKYDSYKCKSISFFTFGDAECVKTWQAPPILTNLHSASLSHWLEWALDSHLMDIEVPAEGLTLCILVFGV